MENSLLDKTWDISGSWYAPRQFLREEIDDVVFCDYIETTSSAGDWSGIVLQQIGNMVNAILFSQENNYPNSGYTLTTSDTVLMSFDITEKTTCFQELFEEACKYVFELSY